MAEISETLKAISVRNQVLLERLKQGEHEKFAPFLKKLEKVVRLRIANETDTPFSRKRLNTLLLDVKLLQKDIYDDYVKQLTLDLFEIGESQAATEAKGLNKVVANFESTIPSASQISTAIRLNPMLVEGYTGIPLLESYVKDWSKERIQQVATTIQQGFSQGQTNGQITRMITELRGTKTNNYNDGEWAKINRSNRTIVRTAVQHSSTQARHETMRENSDLVVGYEWVSTLDSSTSSICAGRDGMKFKDGEGPLPPAHPNCVLGHTVVATCSDVSKLFKRVYKGAIVDVVTKSGRHLSITPNHPILTARGWVVAGDLNSLDKLAVFDGGSVASDNHKNSVKAKIGDIFSALNVVSDSFLVSNRPVSTEHFHGDGTADTNVDTIDVNSKAWYDAKTVINKDFSNNLLILGVRIKSALHGICPLNLRRPVNNPASSGDVSALGKGGPFRVGASIHSCLLLLASISKGSVNTLKKPSNWSVTTIKTNMIGYALGSYARAISIKNKSLFFIAKGDNLRVDNCHVAGLEYPLYGLLSDTKSLAYFLNRQLVDSVELDDVSYIGTRKFNGHVYNLENKEHWYTSNGIITHNCRSATTPVLNEKWDFLKKGAKRASKGESGGAQVSAKETYYSWLKTQPKAFQAEAIGPTKAKLLRDGGLTAEQFAKQSLNRNFEPLSLREWKLKNPSAFDEAGL